jgi:hypothetical protein
MRLVAGLLVLVFFAAACSWERSSESATTTASAPPTTATTSRPPPKRELPRRLERTRDDIVRAAHSFDYDALGDLIEPGVFIYSFDESGNPLRFWRRLESKAEVPVLGDILPVVLSTHPREQEGAFVWPAAAVKKESQWTSADEKDIDRIYGRGGAERFRSLGSYTGWRASIRRDGLWLFFVTSADDY